jgi:hypothetical protein
MKYSIHQKENGFRPNLRRKISIRDKELSLELMMMKKRKLNFNKRNSFRTKIGIIRRKLKPDI